MVAEDTDLTQNKISGKLTPVLWDEGTESEIWWQQVKNDAGGKSPCQSLSIAFSRN